ncbi:MAG: Recombination protein RecR [Alphaproteobacteria bacterium MarineAlpha2_Bin1]|nr:MAG: Recombination protein RecR [Alphaproteobacteria bacterium MarineAlpha2_Bin1]|tara:strand:- start:648 stop:1247 length:600 start_codon:yes stop_codon:yes gene_type:complete
MSDNPNEINNLEQLFSRLPGLGPRSARRVVLHLLKKKDTLMPSLATSLSIAMKSIVNCSSCGNIDITSPCSICADLKRDKRTICVVEDVTDLWALQKVSSFRGQFHVLGGVLSALDGIGPANLSIESLLTRIKENKINEIIIALPVTVDGQTTAHYLKEELSKFNIPVTQLSHGVPVGGELDYLDDGTISAAINSRRPF